MFLYKLCLKLNKMFQDFKNNCPEKDFRVVLKVQDDKCLEMDEEICSIKCKNM